MARRSQLVRFLLAVVLALVVIVVLYFAVVGIYLVLWANPQIHS
jgi:hypothetical protein